MAPPSFFATRSMGAPVPLTPFLTAPGSPEYNDFLTWPFSANLFYEGQVRTLLERDIPQRVLFGTCSVWGYRDPGGNAVAFGSLALCDEYERFTGGLLHAYIPVLGVNSASRGRGHGHAVVQHLVQEAAARYASIQQLAHGAPADAQLPVISDLLFLDVYLANPAKSLYEKHDFVTLNPDTPVPDPEQNNEPYVIMARRLSAAAPRPGGL